MVTRSISRCGPDVHTVPMFDLGISQTEEDDALSSKEVRAIRHKRKVTDDVLSPDNDDELVKEIDAQKQYYRIHGMPLAMQVWLYECCSAVDPKIVVKHGSIIFKLLNWKTTDRRPHFEAFIEGMLADVDNPAVYRNIIATSREMTILQLPSVDAVEDITSDDVSSSDDFQDAPSATEKNKAKKKIDIVSSPVHKKQKQVKSVFSSSNIPSRSFSRNTASPPISVSKASKRSLSSVAKHQTKKFVTQKTVSRRTLPKLPPILHKRKSVLKPPVKSQIGDLRKLIINNFTSVMKSIKSIKIAEKDHNVEAVEDIPVVLYRYLNILALAILVLQSRVILIALSYNRLMAGFPWYTVNHVLIPLHVKEFHWVLVVVSFLDRCLYVYDSYNSAIHDVYVKTEVQKFVETSLLNVDFYKKKIAIGWQCHSKYKNRDESDPFEVIFFDDITQQRSGSMDCGIYVAVYAEFLTVGHGVSNQKFDIALLRTRYAALL
ncbi:hypothetical protein FXO38_20063 [Capsicum annuum]|nr:hypothetical protein FXO38_20063 [Capsicum annuum]KAF3680357.1 hypothetical protein FXO37_03367 [Capsicum annuum]